jgi:subtilase family serine protease
VPSPPSSGPATSSRATSVQACSAAQLDASQHHGYTADQLQDVYGVGQTGLMGGGVTVALVEFEPFFSGDISAYQSCYRTSATVSEETVAPPQEPSPAPCNVTASQWQAYGCGEAALDVEQIIGMAPQAAIKVYEGSDSSQANVTAVYQQIADEDVAQVVSTSWGSCEDSVGSSVASTQATVFAQMAAQGQTIFAATGDNGSEDCYPTTSLRVDDPASQPNVTGVGGTSLTSVAPRTEVVWNNCQNSALTCASTAPSTGYGAGGGGDSRFWPMPSWQSGAVSPDAANCGGSTCRAVPDVAGSADLLHPTAFYWGNQWTVFGGTSAAAPMWAGITALFDEATTVPTSRLGDANPVLYAAAKCGNGAFFDVTSGNNDFTDTNGGQFSATGGYDRATGWGSPDVPVLLADIEAGGCPPPSSPPAATSSTAPSPTTGGLPTVAVLGPGNMVWVYWEAANAQWYGPLGVGPGYGPPTIAVSPSGLPTIAVQGPGNAVYVYWEAANAQWYGPLGVGQGAGRPEIDISPTRGLPTVAVQGPGSALYVFWEASNALWYGPLGVGPPGTDDAAPSIAVS